MDGQEKMAPGDKRETWASPQDIGSDAARKVQLASAAAAAQAPAPCGDGHGRFHASYDASSTLSAICCTVGVAHLRRSNSIVRSVTEKKAKKVHSYQLWANHK